MSVLEVRHPTEYDIATFHMRQKDAEECIRGGSYPRDALAASVEGSDKSFLLLFHEEPAIMWGYTAYKLVPSVAQVWMLTAPVVGDYPWLFLRELRSAMKVLDSNFISYHCMVMRDYLQARRLLKLVGFVEKEGSNPEFIWMEKKGRPLWVN